MSALDPFALGGRQDDDGELIRAEAELRRLLDEGRGCADDDPADAQRWVQISECMTIINGTAPTTLTGCAAKLRLLCDAEIGIETSDHPSDVPSLRQVLAFLESAAGAK